MENHLRPMCLFNIFAIDNFFRTVADIIHYINPHGKICYKHGNYISDYCKIKSTRLIYFTAFLPKIFASNHNTFYVNLWAEKDHCQMNSSLGFDHFDRG